MVGKVVGNVNRLLNSCSDNNCQICKDNYLICTQCKVNTYYFALQSKCVTLAEVPMFYGVDMPTQTILGCSDSNCETCANNRLNCNVCKASYLKVAQVYPD
jgi:hypothetical protein